MIKTLNWFFLVVYFERSSFFSVEITNWGSSSMFLYFLEGFVVYIMPLNENEDQISNIHELLLISLTSTKTNPCTKIK